MTNARSIVRPSAAEMFPGVAIAGDAKDEEPRSFAATYAPNNRPFRRTTRLAEIFAKVPQQWRSVAAEDVYHRPHKDRQALLGFVLMSCPVEQMRFLACVWDKFHPDEDFTTAFSALVKRGRLLDVIDHTSKEHEKSLLLVYDGVMEARGKM